MKFAYYLILSGLFFSSISCQKISKKQKEIERNCDINISDLKLIYTKDTSKIKAPKYFSSVIQLKMSLSITNNSKDSIFVKFNDLFSTDFNCEIIGEIKGFRGFKFYTYPFLYQIGLIANHSVIGPGQKVKCDLESPILDLFLNKDIIDINNFYNKLDSIRVFVMFAKNNCKVELNTIGIKKSIEQIDPVCIGTFNLIHQF